MIRRRETEDTKRSGLIPKTMPCKHTLTEKYPRVRTQILILDGQTEMLINRISTVVSHVEEIFVCD